MVRFCDSQKINTNDHIVKLITLDPGHFHAALVQKEMYDNVDPIVHVYAPPGQDVALHLERINTYNSRSENPSQWKEEVYTGNDFLEKMLYDKKGNVVVIAGNNRKKTEYIFKSLNAGFNVLADKPMVINKNNFQKLINSFAVAKKNKVLLYDIMTERFEITTILQRELSMIPGIFGQLEKGTPDDPAITKESTHYFYKYVSGSVLIRPPWFMDVTQEGDGIVDVTTHLVDLIQWECFPEQIIDYHRDIKLLSANRSSTDISLSQFNEITKLNGFLDYLRKDVVNSKTLKVFCNGEMKYKLRGVNAKVSVNWSYKAPEGAGDSHYSIMRGTLANLIIRQGAEQQYKPALYIEPVNKKDISYERELNLKMRSIIEKYKGVTLKKMATGWEVIIPEKLKEGHESHFARVTENFLNYMKKGKLPTWEVPGMIAKYYTTTEALEIANKTLGLKQ